MELSIKLLIASAIWTILLSSSCVQETNQVYLENVGHYSAVMTKFIDSLLEKASYLADVVIENSLNEECEPVCVRKSLDNWNNLNNKSSLLLNRQGKPRVMADNPRSCAIFGIEVREEDLPSKDMVTCCRRYHECYQECGRAKLSCDIQFQGCLNNLCRDKFSDTVEKYTTCQLSIKVLIIGNLAFGCKEYKQQQGASCCDHSKNQYELATASTPAQPILAE